MSLPVLAPVTASKPAGRTSPLLFLIATAALLLAPLGFSAADETPPGFAAARDQAIADYVRATALSDRAKEAGRQMDFATALGFSRQAWEIVSAIGEKKALPESVYLQIRFNALEQYARYRRLRGLDSTAEDREVYRLAGRVHGEKGALRYGGDVLSNLLQANKGVEATILAHELYEIAKKQYGEYSGAAIGRHQELLVFARGVVSDEKWAEISSQHRKLLEKRLALVEQTHGKDSFEYYRARLDLAAMSPPHEAIPIIESMISEERDEGNIARKLEMNRVLAAKYNESGQTLQAVRIHEQTVGWMRQSPALQGDSRYFDALREYSAALDAAGDHESAVTVLTEGLRELDAAESKPFGVSDTTHFRSGLHLALADHYERTGDHEQGLVQKRLFLNATTSRKTFRIGPGREGLIHEWIGELFEASRSGRMKRPENQPAALFSEAFANFQLLSNRTGLAISRAAARQQSFGVEGLGTAFSDWEDATVRAESASDRLSQYLKSMPPAEMREAGERLRQELSDMRSAAEEQAADALRTITGIAPRIADMIEPGAIDIDTIRHRLIRDNEALVGFYPASKPDLHPIVWVMTREQVKWAAAGRTMAELERDIQALRRELGGGDRTLASKHTVSGSAVAGRVPAFDRNLAHRIYGALFADPEIEGILSGVQNWIIVPAGPLFDLPYNVLVTEPPRGENRDPAALRQTSWLGIEKTLAIVPSISALKTQRFFREESGRAPGTSFFGVGDPDFRGAPSGDRSALANAARVVTRNGVVDTDALRSLPRLPGTRREVIAMAKLLGAGKGAYLLGRRANETNLANASLSGALGQAGVVLFATHGLIGGTFEGLREPALVLSPPVGAPREIRQVSGVRPTDSDSRLLGVDDGLLTATEVTQLSINADWVILSACDTAAGDELGGEGLSGLARAFLFSGSRSLLVTHWPIQDEVAVRLTTGAVSRSENDRSLSHGDALRLSMKSVLMDEENPQFAHPSLWAPFVLVGVE